MTQDIFPENIPDICHDDLQNYPLPDFLPVTGNNAPLEAEPATSPGEEETLQPL